MSRDRQERCVDIVPVWYVCSACIRERFRTGFGKSRRRRNAGWKSRRILVMFQSKLKRKKLKARSESDAQDPRLERLLAAQQEQKRPARRRHVEAEIIMDEEEKPVMKFDAPPQPAKEKEDDSAGRRRRLLLLSHALEDVGW